jgi:hypothetical protein
MTVKELIEKLQTLNQDKMIVINGYEGGCDFPTNIAPTKILMNQNTQWYYGKHEYVLPIHDEYEQHEWNAYVLD